jgi:DNA-binding GntR family transcriptional regulator
MNADPQLRRSGTLVIASLHDRLIARLREMVVDGRLAPGTPISEKTLCEEFGVSRTPLREALKVLASEGLIELPPRRGAVVMPIVTERLREQFDLVRLLENYAIEVACERASQTQLDELQRIHERLVKSFRKGPGPHLYEINDQFHEAIMRASGNQTLVEVHGPLWLHLRRARRLVLTMHGVTSAYVESHERLMRAICRRDAAAAVAEMSHRWDVARQILDSLADAPGTDGSTSSHASL